MALGRFYEGVYRNHFAFMFRFLEKKRNRLPANFTAEDLFKRTFWKFIQSIDTFELSPEMTLDAVSKRTFACCRKPLDRIFADVWREERLRTRDAGGTFFFISSADGRRPRC
jgi:hypothetical protein